MKPDWIVSRVSLTTDAKNYGTGVHCPLFVHGVNLSDQGRRFWWRLPADTLFNPRYDLTNAQVDDECRNFIPHGPYQE